MSHCAEQDRLSKEWRKRLKKFAEAVSRLPQTLEDGNFNEQYHTSRLAGEYAENASQALALHRSMHQCGEIISVSPAISGRTMNLGRAVLPRAEF